MSLTLSEFAKSIANLAGEKAGNDASEQLSAQVLVGDVEALIKYESLPDVQLGGLLRLPRAKVTLELSGGDERQRNAFLRRFDVSFQRGGG